MTGLFGRHRRGAHRIAIKEFGATIARVAEIASAIAAAIDEQTPSRDISRSVPQAAEGTAPVAGSIAEVARAAGKTASAAGQILGLGTRAQPTASQPRE
jgi:methyl-accepting chemotaxis protein